MEQQKQIKAHASQGVRWGIRFLTAALALLLIWLLGFLINDIRGIEGPDYQAIRSEYVDEALEARNEEIEAELRQLNQQIDRQEERKRNAQQMRESAQQTVDNMLRIETQGTLTGAQQAVLTDAQQKFLQAQEDIQSSVVRMAELEQQRFELNQELDRGKEQVEAQEEPARERFQELNHRHRIKLSALELAVIVPLFILAAWGFRRTRGTLWRPVLTAFLIATSWGIFSVIHEYFPTELFKYLAILVAIAVTVKALLALVAAAIRPRVEDVLKRYREAYNQQRCPICTFPIRRGPWRHAFWSAKGPMGRQSGAAVGSVEAEDNAPYTCPSCGTALFEECPECTHTRHSLLPWCEHCGHEKEVDPGRHAGE